MRPFSGALRLYNYRLWATADLVSTTGTWMQVLGVNWYLLEATGSATKMSLGIVLQAAPTVLLGPVAGSIADRLAPRRLLLVSHLLHALLAAALAISVAGGGRGVLPVYVISFLSGLVTAFDGPALGRFGSMIVGPKLLGTAVAMGSVIHSAGRIMGMSVGGVLVAAVGPAALFGLNALSFLAVIAALLGMRTREWHPLAREAAGSASRGVRAGLLYVLRQPIVLTVLCVAFVLGSLGRNYQVTMAAMSAGPLGGGATGYGVLSTAFAVGSILGGILAAQRGQLGLRLLLGAGGLASVLQLTSGFAPGLYTFAALLVPIAAAAVVVDTTVSARIQLDTREEMRGRVVAVVAMVGSLAGMTGAPALGWLSGAIGPRATLVLAGAIGMMACLAAALAIGRLQSRVRTERSALAMVSSSACTERAATACGCVVHTPHPSRHRPAASPGGQPSRHRDGRAPKVSPMALPGYRRRRRARLTGSSAGA